MSNTKQSRQNPYNIDNLYFHVPTDQQSNKQSTTFHFLAFKLTVFIFHEVMFTLSYEYHLEATDSKESLSEGAIKTFPILPFSMFQNNLSIGWQVLGNGN